MKTFDSDRRVDAMVPVSYEEDNFWYFPQLVLQICLGIQLESFGSSLPLALQQAGESGA